MYIYFLPVLIITYPYFEEQRGSHRENDSRLDQQVLNVLSFFVVTAVQWFTMNSPKKDSYIRINSLEFRVV